MNALVALAAICFAMSALVHVLSVLGINVQRHFPIVWILHILIFVVWFPAVLVSRNLVAKGNRKDFWKLATLNAPSWMRILCIALIPYIFINFFYTELVLSEGGVPGQRNGKKVLENHGRMVKELTDREYEQQQDNEARAFSGHWMIFYMVGWTVLVSHVRGSKGFSPTSEGQRESAGAGSQNVTPDVCHCRNRHLPVVLLLLPALAGFPCFKSSGSTRTVMSIDVQGSDARRWKASNPWTAEPFGVRCVGTRGDPVCIRRGCGANRGIG